MMRTKSCTRLPSPSITANMTSRYSPSALGKFARSIRSRVMATASAPRPSAASDMQVTVFTSSMSAEIARP